MRIGIDLLWVRVGICGGTESYIRNLLDGFAKYASGQEYVLFVARDNADSFQHYSDNTCMRLHVCPVDCANQAKRILWENLHLHKTAKQERVELMFIPVYSKPWSYGEIPYVTVIHDLQALHYPEYFSRVKRLFLKYAWWRTCRTSDKVIVTSDYTKRDLIAHYPGVEHRAHTIPIAIISNAAKEESTVLEKYNIEKKQYFYCVSSMLPHKNLETILRVMQKRKLQGNTQEKLVLSGVGGEEQKVQMLVKELDIEEMLVFTGFVSDEERDCLYKNCQLFLFPSVFEGFGMPPIEAMRKGCRVVMTEKACLREVTEGKAIYVDAPYDVEEWMQKMEAARMEPERVEKFERYNLDKVVGQYMKAFEEMQKDFGE